jgi:hypothetical protein
MMRWPDAGCGLTSLARNFAAAWNLWLRTCEPLTPTRTIANLNIPGFCACSAHHPVHDTFYTTAQLRDLTTTRDACYFYIFLSGLLLYLFSNHRPHTSLSPPTLSPRVRGAPSTLVTTMSDLSTICEKMSMDSTRSDMDSSPSLFLVQDFGWPRASPRYRGDHTQESNPDWEHDPMACAKAKQEAMRKMEVSYALYMANMGQPITTKKTSTSKDGWIRYVMPWKWTARREVVAL